jgi:hypothetical protein
MKTSEHKRREPLERLEMAYARFLHGSPGSDEDAAMSMIFWAQMEEITGIESAARIANNLRRWWLEKSLKAVRTDSDFFRRIAGFLEAEQREPRGNRALNYVYLAYMRLFQNPNVDVDEITKHDVETMAKRWWAFWRLSAAGKMTGSFEDSFGDEREELISREIKLLPKQRWQDIWKRPEFAALKDAKRGPKSKFPDSKK